MFSDKTTSTESQLWSKVKAGDRQAFAEVYNTHIKEMYNYGNKIFRNSSLVEDAVHDLFVDLWNYRKNLSPINSIRAYLYASLRRKITKSTKDSIFLVYEDKWDEPHLLTDSAEEKLIKKEFLDEQSKKLQSHLNNLSPRQYEAITLRFYDKLSYQEIANVMDVNEQSVRNIIQRGLENLRQYARITISLLLLLHIDF